MINWQLSIAYFIHLLATVTWIGGITLSALVILPVASQLLNDPHGLLLLDWQRRFTPLAITSLIALSVTGLMQMAANPNYGGLLAIDNTWALAILIKHIAFLLMVAITAYSAWSLHPQMARQALLIAKDKPGDQFARLRQRQLLLNRLNLLCAVFVLIFTSIARVT